METEPSSRRRTGPHAREKTTRGIPILCGVPFCAVSASPTVAFDAGVNVLGVDLYPPAVGATIGERLRTGAPAPKLCAVLERAAKGKLGVVPGMLSLTFDDGPDEIGTLAIVSALRRCEARATFFMVGERAQAAPSLVRSVLAAGHEVQLHCHRHIRHNELSEAEIELDTDAALETFATFGVRPTHWRTPWGIQTPATVSVARRRRLRLVGWTLDTHDWRGDPSSSMLATVRPYIAGGGIILMHDGLGPGARRTACENTIDLLAPLIALARARGLDLGPLDLDARPPDVDARPTVDVGPF